MYIDFAGYLLFKDFCENVCDEPVPQLKFYEEVSVLNVECCVLVCVCVRVEPEGGGTRSWGRRYLGCSQRWMGQFDISV